VMLCGWEGNRAGLLSQTMVVCPATVQSLNGRSAPRPLRYVPYCR